MAKGGRGGKGPRAVRLLALFVMLGAAGALHAAPAPPDSVEVVPAPPDSAATAPVPASVDSTAGEPLLQRLQEADRNLYPPELLETDPGLRDSSLAALDSLGLAGYEHRYRGDALEAGLTVASSLITYNRVEALVAGLGLNLDARGGAHLNLQAAYATGPRKLRHLERLEVPVRGLVLEGGYADRVVAYGSNTPTANGLRALVGSADEQDYLRRSGARAGVRRDGRHGSRVGAAYEAARDRSVERHTDFAFLGDSRLMGVNLPVAEGMTRSVVLEAAWGRLGDDRLHLDLRHRVAGGGLGGDFDFVRTDFHGSIRRYLPGNHEVVWDLALARAGGAPPVQELADVGGLCTVRGFDRRTRVGRTSLAARLELFPAFDPLGAAVPALAKARLQFVPWADAGRVWDGNSDAWLTSAGIGVQHYIAPLEDAAYLRLDAAFPLGPDRPETVRFLLRFARALF